MTWQEFYSNYINLDPGIVEIFLRLLCAMLVGTLIGLEREFTHRPAGLRTHILVALGACIASVVGHMLFAQYGGASDPARLSAQVITGVGFLGAGTIMKEGATVKGLTTAASVWAVACLGIAAGFGYYAVAVLGMVLIFITLRFLDGLQRRLLQIGSSEIYYVLETTDISASLTRINEIAQEEHINIFDLAAEQTDFGHRVTFRGWYSGRHYKHHHRCFFNALAAAQESRRLYRDAKTGITV